MIPIKLAIFIFAELGFISANPSPVIPHEIVKNQQYYPFVAALRKNDKFVCAGAIITLNAIVTSASCAERLTPQNCEKLTATAGITEADAECFGMFPNIQTVKIKSVIVHPGFSKCTENNNDVAVVNLDGNFSKTKHVGPIKLVDGIRSCLSGKATDIVGWGIDRCEYKINHMAVLVATLVSKEDCSCEYSPLKRYETMGCGYLGAQPEIWHGSGSPVIIFDKCNPDNHMLVGIALNPEKQTKFKSPFVFTEIQDVADFIKKSI